MVGRKKQFEKRLTLPLSEAMLERVDNALVEGEARLDLIRTAIERELHEREAAPSKE